MTTNENPKNITRWTPELIADMTHRYTVRGENPISIGKALGCSGSTVTNVLRKAGVPARATWSRNPKSKGLIGASPETLEAIVAEYKAEALIEDLALKYGVSLATIHKALKAAGVARRSVGPAREFNEVGGSCGCVDCKQVKPLEEFHISPKSVTGRTSICKDCDMIRYRLRMYKLDNAAYLAMVEAQGNTCKACGATPESERNSGLKTLCVDHCHTSGKVRGLLCHHCNIAVGMLDDSLAIAEKVSAYIRGFTA